MADLPEIIEATKKSIAVVKLPTGQCSSAFFVNDKGLFATNKHSVALYSYVKVILQDGKEIEGTVVYADNDIDYAFITTNIQNSPLIPLADSDLIKEGEQVIAIGHPYGYDFTVSKGIISCKNRIVKGIKYIQTDVAINPGNSGGPLINNQGEAIGINSWIVDKAENMSFAIPANSIKKMLKTLNENYSQLPNLYYCPVCGYSDTQFIKTTKAEYCKNCGTQKFEKNKAEELKLPQEQAQPVKVAAVVCPKCKETNDASSNFCKNCGYKMK